jgi:hypothetical protein
MRKRAALNHYLSTYDIIFTEIVEAIIGITSETKRVYDKKVEAEKLMLREYLSKLMTKN